MRLLLVEDDDALAGVLKKALAEAGFVVERADNGVDGHFLGCEESFDVVVLDLGLPGKPGLSVLKEWRTAGLAMPVLILTARDGWQERVDGLKAGADDYLGKPFHTEELLARLEALVRRKYGRADNLLSAGGVTLHPDSQGATSAAGEFIPLTGIEFRLLRHFLMNPGRVISKTELSEHAYEEEQLRDSNVIEVYINRLRHQFGRSFIETRRGQGYLLGVSALGKGER